MPIASWFFRDEARAAQGVVCGYCDQQLAVCPRCFGAWREHAPCDCGIGLKCPRCNSSWG